MKIAIDAGHGPRTAGKRAPDGSMLEFEFNSAVASLLKSRLLVNGFKVKTVHRRNRDVSLRARADEANKWKADLYVSIHADAQGGQGFGRARGIETYCWKRSGSAEKLAKSVQSELIRQTGARDRGVKTANFWVLRKTDMPAILVEGGFMTNREDLVLLKSESYREQIATGISVGVTDYLHSQRPADLACIVRETPVPQKLINGEMWVMLRPTCKAAGLKVDASGWPKVTVS